MNLNVLPGWRLLGSFLMRAWHWAWPAGRPQEPLAPAEPLTPTASPVHAQSAPAAVVPAVAVVPAMPVSPPVVAKKKDDLTCHWHFRKDILDRLDEYFMCARRMRKHDRHAYDLMSQVGMAIPAAYDYGQFTMPPVDRRAFGGVLGPWKDDDDFLYPSFIYFQKVTSPRLVEPACGDIYSVTAIYDDRRKDKHWEADVSEPVQCHITIQPDNNGIRLLREPFYVDAKIPRRCGNRKETITLTRTEWMYPKWICQYAAYRKWNGPHEAARRLFLVAFRTYLAVMDRFLIRATRGTCVATFSIDLPRAKYFFADRDFEPANDGRRRRIFHAVVAHERVLTDGRRTSVKAHFRGARTFLWHKDRIHIVLPKNASVLKFETPGKYQDDMSNEEWKDMLPIEQMGSRMAEILEA